MNKNIHMNRLRPQTLALRAIAAVILLVAGNVLAQTSSPIVYNYAYDNNGNLTQVTDGLGRITRQSYDPLNRPAVQTDARSGLTQLGYDPLDHVTSVSDPRSLVTHYTVDGLNNLKLTSSPDTGTGISSSTFDAAGNLTSRFDSRGVRTGISYDGLSRPKYLIFSQGSLTENYIFDYDQNVPPNIINAAGRLTGHDYPVGNARYGYDGLGRLFHQEAQVFAQTGANSRVWKSLTYGYDLAGHRTSVTYPSGRVINFTYVQGYLNAVSLQASASATVQPLLTQIHSQPFGAPDHWLWQMGTGTQSYSRTFDTSGRLASYALASFTRTVNYDAAGRISSYSHVDSTTGTATAAATAMNQSFSYDELGRVTGVTLNSATWGITYDANGNRTGLTINGVAQPYTTAATSNQLSSVANPARSFTYDTAGNITGDSANYAATYGLRGKLATMTNAGTTTSYSYDTLGQRVRKTSCCALRFHRIPAQITIARFWQEWT